MNFYKVTGQVTRKCSWFLKNLGFKNIESISDGSYNIFNVHMKDGLTAQIRFNDPGVRGIYWSVEDFENQAKQRYDIHLKDYPKAETWEDVYDKETFEDALESMIDNHDCNYGISWETVNFYLDEESLRPTNKTYITLSTNDESDKSSNFIVDEELLTILEKLQNAGGFLRFHIDIIQDNIGGKLEKEEVINWLISNIDKNMVIF
jgi:hypothetical protein